MDVSALTARQIGERLGISKSSAVKFSRQGRFGEPISRLSRTWRWADDEVLADMISTVWTEPRPPTKQAAVHNNHHLKRLIDFANGRRDDADSEDYEMAAELLRIAARCFERRASGLRSTCTLSARFAVMNLLSKARAGDATTPARLRGSAAKLAALA